MKVQLKSTDGTENLYPVTSANSVIFPDGNNLEAKFPELVGKSAYQSWLDAGHTGTEAEFVESLQGKDGRDGDPAPASAVVPAVEDWLDEHPEATTTVQDWSVGMVKLSSDVLKRFDDPFGIEKAYKYVTYESGVLDVDGTVKSGAGFCSPLLPVVPGETIVLNKDHIGKVAFFTEQKTFISIVSTTTGLNDYTVPGNAFYARYQVVYNGGSTAYLSVRRKTFSNKSFSDLILSPLKTRPSIGFTGDSNTLGYGLASGDKSWANLIAEALTGIQTMRYDNNSAWVESLGYMAYSGQSNFKGNSEMSIYTDSTSVTLGWAAKYSSAWKWYVDGVESGTESASSIELDGSFHKVTVKFSAGQLVAPFFTVAKAITCTNDAVTGVSISNMTFNSGYDWIFIMIGTNHRSSYYKHDFKFAQYSKHGTYIVPFPNHKSDNSYTISQLQAYTFEMEMFRHFGYDILNMSDVNAEAFFDDTYYQNDKIHYSAAGHRVMANMIAGRLGLPLYLKAQ